MRPIHLPQKAPWLPDQPTYPQAHRGIFGCLNTVAGWRKTRFRGFDGTEWDFTLALAAYNLTRMPNVLANETGPPRRRTSPDRSCIGMPGMSFRAFSICDHFR